MCGQSWAAIHEPSKKSAERALKGFDHGFVCVFVGGFVGVFVCVFLGGFASWVANSGQVYTSLWCGGRGRPRRKNNGRRGEKRKKGQAAPKHFSIHDHIHTATGIKPSSCGAHRKVSRIQFCLHSSTISKTPAIDKAPTTVKKRQHLRQGTKRTRPYIYIYIYIEDAYGGASPHPPTPCSSAPFRK